MNLTRSLIAATLALALPAVSHAALNAYLKIDSIKGEVADTAHKDEIAIESWSFGTSIEAAGKPGGMLGKACLSELVLVKPVDRASPPLLQAAMLGQHLKEATLAVRRAGAKPLDYLVIRMTDVLVTSVKQAGGAESTLEEIALDFASMRMTYRMDDPKGGNSTSVEASVSDCGPKL